MLNRLRAVGVAAGIAGIGLGVWWLVTGLADPPTQNLGLFIAFGLSPVLPGILLALPWSRIRPPALWYALFITLVIAGPFSAMVILGANAWSIVHGAAGPGVAIAGLLVLIWLTQLPVIWALRRTRA